MEGDTYPKAEEEIWVRCVRNIQGVPGWQNQLKRGDSVDGQPDLIRLPRITAAQTQPSNTCE